MHRYCKNTEIGCVPFNLLEAWVWVHMEKWNILWADDDTWLPQDANVLTRDRLPHGFHKVIINETDEDYLQVWVEVAGRGSTLLQRKVATTAMLVGQIHAVLPS